jgi:hypothetical protein
MVHLTKHLVAQSTERIVRILVNSRLEWKWLEEIMEKIKAPSQRIPGMTEVNNGKPLVAVFG